MHISAKKVLIVLCFLVPGLRLMAQNTAYYYSYGGIQNDVCYQVRATYDSGYIMIGTTNSWGAGANDFYAIKVDSAGKKQWSKTYGGPLDEEGYSVVQTFDSGYAFVGWTDSYGAGGYDAWLVKTDKLGNVQWQKAYGGSNWDFGYSVKQTTDSGFILCGLTYSYGAGNGDVYIVKTDKNGDTLWTRAVGGAGYDIGNSVCISNDSIYFVVGQTTSFGIADSSMYFIKINNKGTVEKDTTFGWKGDYAAYGINNTKKLADYFLVVGYTDSNGGVPYPDHMIIDTNLRFKWEMTLPYPHGYSRDINECKDGSLICAATSDFGGYGGYDMVTLNLNYIPTSPFYLWWQNGPFEGGVQDEQGNSCDLNYGNGNCVFAGATDSYVYSAGLDDFFLVRYKGCSSIQPDGTMNHVYTQYKDSLPITVGINEPAAEVLMAKVFPDPVTDIGTIVLQDADVKKACFNLYNTLGQCVISNLAMKSAGHGQMMAHFTKAGLQPGIYFYSVNTDGNKEATGKIIVQ